MSEYYEDDFEASGTGGLIGKGSNLSPMIIKGGANSGILMPPGIGANKVCPGTLISAIERWS